ncbi:hypothetical protein ACIBEJ_00940 [Nonomuraea sp. NPDC050790]|uniref:hypothetical protein n=1 Tax=Nonomuraea sp. NPDC050790 TaxID=3364371 RepID=UPI00379CC8FE
MAEGAKPSADWSLTSRGTTSGTSVGVLALAAAAVAGHAADVDPYYCAFLTVGAGVGSVVRSMLKNATSPALVFRLLRSLFAGGWVSYVQLTEPTPGVFYTIAAAGVVAGALAPLFEAGPKTSTSKGRSVVLRKTTKLAEHWENLILQVTGGAVRITEVTYWDTGAGFTLHGVLPLTMSLKQLGSASNCDRLADAARLPNGCGVEIRRGGQRGMFAIDVATVNRLTQDVDWPGTLQMTSINQPKPLGEHRDSTPVLVSLREAAAVVIGMRGSGKTTCLHGLTWQCGMCFDAIVWHMDLNGGGLSQPWLRPWIEGVTDRPAIDWAAADLEEGLAMSEVFLDILHDRKTTYAHLKIDQDVGLMPVGDGLTAPPAIQLLVDEGAEALAPNSRDPLKRRLRENLEEAQRIGRDGAGNVLVSSLRATQDMLAAQIVKQASLRIGMLVQDHAEYNYLYGWHFPFTLDDLHGKGTGFIQTMEAPIRPWKAGNLRPSLIRQGAIHVANHRPELDAAGIAVAGEVYATRLERMRARFTPGAELVPMPDAFLERHGLRDEQQPSTPAAPAAGGIPSLSVIPGGVEGILARYNLAPDRAQPPLHAEQVHQLEATDAMPLGRLGDLPPVLRACLQHMDQQHTNRMHTVELAAALGLTKRELGDLLRAIGVRSHSQPFERRGKSLRGYERTAFEEAARRIREGVQHVPEEVARWSA